MATAIIRGAAKGMKGKIAFAGYDIDPKKAEALSDVGLEAKASAAELVEWSDYVLFSVKPQNFPEMFASLSGASHQDKVFISIAAGITAEAIKTALGFDAKVVLVMPDVYKRQVQVRPFSDSFYPSELFPWSSYCSGTLGKALSYDPMKIMVSEAKRRKLKIEAWVNPMRAMTTLEIKNVPSEFPIRQWYDDSSLKSQNLIEYDGRLYFNPASAEARKLIADGAAEIVKNYDVDGVHIDDYFYPPSLPNSYDKAQYDAYIKAGGKLSQADWRRDNTSKMVKEMNEAIKKANSTALFGISPRGVVSQNVDQLYIDVAEWCSTPGYCDYIAPQLYYGFKHSTAAYDTVMKQWSDLVTCDEVELLVGLAAYKVCLLYTSRCV